eukprot:6056779-Ditylum_brightwellii.AAC.1
MKIDHKSLEFANQNVKNKPQPTSNGPNPKDKKFAVYNLVVKYYKVGTPEEWLQFIDTITEMIKEQDIQDRDATSSLVKSLLKEDALQVFKNEESS